jgi:hypothetical protein
MVGPWDTAVRPTDGGLMRRVVAGSVALVLSLAACQDDLVFVDDGLPPAAPTALAVSYYAGSVTVTWELAPDWNEEAFRVYARRVTDADFFFIAEVTSCIEDFCSYEDLNVTAGETYEYVVSAVSSSGIETESSFSVEQFVPQPTAPPVPDSSYVIALDDANYLAWGVAGRAADDFSHYKVYVDDGVEVFLLGETDSEGFLDLLAVNGVTYGYFVTSVDTDGHESDDGILAEGTPRPDFTGEWLYGYGAQPEQSGFVFVEEESTIPVIDGDAAARHFRLETDPNGWWLVSNGLTTITAGQVTTALKCGVAADANCVDLMSAPLSSAEYSNADLSVETQTSYALRVVGNDDQFHYGVIRVDLLGFDQNNVPIMIFDWAYQLQAGNPNLATSPRG